MSVDPGLVRRIEQVILKSFGWNDLNPLPKDTPSPMLVPSVLNISQPFRSISATWMAEEIAKAMTPPKENAPAPVHRLPSKSVLDPAAAIDAITTHVADWKDIFIIAIDKDERMALVHSELRVADAVLMLLDAQDIVRQPREEEE